MAQRSPAGAAILDVSLELLAVALFTLIAGASDDVGKTVLIVMAGLWLIYIISYSDLLSSLNNKLQQLVGNPTNK